MLTEITGKTTKKQLRGVNPGAVRPGSTEWTELAPKWREAKAQLGLADLGLVGADDGHYYFASGRGDTLRTFTLPRSK